MAHIAPRKRIDAKAGARKAGGGLDKSQTPPPPPKRPTEDDSLELLAAIARVAMGEDEDKDGED